MLTWHKRKPVEQRSYDREQWLFLRQLLVIEFLMFHRKAIVHKLALFLLLSERRNNSFCEILQRQTFV